MEESKSPVERLSPRMRDVLRLVYARKRTKQIAVLLELREGTVAGYIADAVRLLDARDRVDAAERLHAWETAQASSDEPPSNVPPFDQGVQSTPLVKPTVPTEHGGHEWRRLLPFRTKGVAGNDLSILQRLAWIPGLAIAFAIGFGMLAVGVRIINDLVASLLHR